MIHRKRLKTSHLIYNDSKTPVEGIVVRSTKEQLVDGDRLSFKVINLKYDESRRDK